MYRQLIQFWKFVLSAWKVVLHFSSFPENLNGCANTKIICCYLLHVPITNRFLPFHFTSSSIQVVHDRKMKHFCYNSWRRGQNCKNSKVAWAIGTICTAWNLTFLKDLLTWCLLDWEQMGSSCTSIQNHLVCCHAPEPTWKLCSFSKAQGIISSIRWEPDNQLKLSTVLTQLPSGSKI